MYVLTDMKSEPKPLKPSFSSATSILGTNTELLHTQQQQEQARITVAAHPLSNAECKCKERPHLQCSDDTHFEQLRTSAKTAPQAVVLSGGVVTQLHQLDQRRLQCLRLTSHAGAFH